MIVLKSDNEIDAMRAAGEVSATILDKVSEILKPGANTQQINEFVHAMTLEMGAVPAPLNYKGYPKSVCTSVNDVVCHGIPSTKQKLKEGDIINIDVTSIVDGYHGDTSRMYEIGEPSDKAKRLCRVAHECLFLGINTVADGARVGDIGAAIQAHAEKNGYSVVREFVGHGIGKGFHEEPQIPHYGSPGRGPRLKPGMVFTIEPMINEGHWKTKVLKDGWTAITLDGSLSAQWEHTIGIKSDGSLKILTESQIEIDARPSF